MSGGRSHGRQSAPVPINPSKITSYPDAMRFLYGLVNVERMRSVRSVEDTFKLDLIRRLLAELGDPQNSIPMAHVAGTKGKGSTVAMVASALRGAGLTVGEYTSPHLIDLTERIRINRENIPEDDVIELTRDVATVAVEIAPTHGLPQFFEALTAMAFLYFARKAVDIAVIEVGLGGRLDSTNVITPIVTAITQISFDHMDILGDTLESIAREKAGIFKPGVPAVSTPQQPEVKAVLREIAAATPCELRFLDDDDLEFTYRREAAPGPPHARISLITPDSTFEHVATPLAGEHQALNCGLALAMVDCLRRQGWNLPEPDIEDGLAETRLEGRMELIRTSPRIVIDGAHNEESVRALMRSLGPSFPYDSLVVIFGCGIDKDVDGMLRAVATGADKLIFTRARSNPKAMDPNELQSRFSQFSGKMNQVAPNLAEAYELALRAVGSADLICVTGSFYLAGEAKTLFGRPAPIEVKTRSDDSPVANARGDANLE